jgi:hypothetical protein
MSKFLIIVLGVFLVLAAINFISALSCSTSHIQKTHRCLPVPTGKREFLDQLPGSRKTRDTLIEKPVCPPGYIWYKGKCRKISVSQSGSTKCPPGQVLVHGRCQRKKGA